MSLDVSIVADPGLPYDLIYPARDQIASRLEETLGREITLSVQVDALSMSPDGSVHWSDSIGQAGGDSKILLFITELPRLWRDRPAPVEVDTTQSTGIISVPAAGSVLLRRRLTRLVIAASAALADPVEGSAAARAATPPRRRWMADESHSGRSILVASSRMGRFRTVMGMARVNRPWRLVATLKGAIAAAAAAASFGIFYTSIWSMSAALSTRRLAMVMALSVLVMTVWLIVGNRLWESKTHGKVWDRLYNASTVVTVLIGVLTMYAGLFILTLFTGMVIIDQTFMAQKLAGEASFANYLMIAWLSTSMGVIAGALGSSSDSYDAILHATFGNRERERRMAEEPEK